jgi:serine/threonine protein kinase
VQSKTSTLSGLSFTSNKKNTWTFGNFVNKGGFGSIYTNGFKTDNILIKVGKDAVFYEKSVLRKLAADCKNNIPEIIDSGKLSSLGLDEYFIVMPNYGQSLHSMLVVNPLSSQLLKSMMTDMLSALDYIDSKKYMHLDVNPKNIVFDHTKNVWYLIDFGNAKNFRDGKFISDKKYVNHGTPLYMSRGAHEGLMSRKCDLESLIYTMLVSEYIHLPWEKIKSTSKICKKEMYKQKCNFFQKHVPDLKLPKYQYLYILNVDALTPTIRPDYSSFKNIFISEMPESEIDRLIESKLKSC